MYIYYRVCHGSITLIRIQPEFNYLETLLRLTSGVSQRPASCLDASCYYCHKVTHTDV